MAKVLIHSAARLASIIRSKGDKRLSNTTAHRSNQEITRTIPSLIRRAQKQSELFVVILAGIAEEIIFETSIIIAFFVKIPTCPKVTLTQKFKNRFHQCKKMFENHECKSSSCLFISDTSSAQP